MGIVSSVAPFSKGATGVYQSLFYSVPKNNSVKIYRYSKNRNDKFAYINKEQVVAKTEWIDTHKVYVSKAGEISAKFNGLPFYGEPNSICSETYLLVGPFDSKQICNNAIKYMNTCLYKYLISQIKKTQNAARSVYKFVPMQDFTENSDIDWTKSIEEIDQQLYAKYGLTQEEINFIEKMIKPMGD